MDVESEERIMPKNLMDLAETIEKLTEEERAVETLLSGLRFSEKRVCPFCGGTHVVKNGKRADGTQKYICRECGRNPLATSNSLLCGTHKDLTTWLKWNT